MEANCRGDWNYHSNQRSWFGPCHAMIKIIQLVLEGGTSSCVQAKSWSNEWIWLWFNLLGHLFSWYHSLWIILSDEYSTGMERIKEFKSIQRISIDIHVPTKWHLTHRIIIGDYSRRRIQFLCVKRLQIMKGLWLEWTMKLIIDSTSLIEILQYSFGAKDSTPKHLWSLRYLSQPRLSSSTQTRILKY